eukprot:CAMPEP_0168570170 /NCGR_PEP_ID=MMETSP0413-20121227/16574_1 /TAXON_ID=136452 /ORGANISM="Filamoeba nolandi, Strain NC-AS-23-1" /LENGTH=658 /DNA_ID=CAMNT_0008602767 /DNA_START=34 /DNA_END=2010 /DNA_ORIENTATION=-
MDSKRTFDQINDGSESNPLSNILNYQLPNPSEIDSTFNNNGETVKRIKTNQNDVPIASNVPSNVASGPKPMNPSLQLLEEKFDYPPGYQQMHQHYAAHHPHQNQPTANVQKVPSNQSIYRAQNYGMNPLTMNALFGSQNSPLVSMPNHPYNFHNTPLPFSSGNNTMIPPQAISSYARGGAFQRDPAFDLATKIMGDLNALIQYLEGNEPILLKASNLTTAYFIINGFINTISAAQSQGFTHTAPLPVKTVYPNISPQQMASTSSPPGSAAIFAPQVPDFVRDQANMNAKLSTLTPPASAQVQAPSQPATSPAKPAGAAYPPLSMFKPFSPIKTKPAPPIDFSKLSLDDFEWLDILGTGTFGKVRLCKHKLTQKFFCMKILNKSRIVRLKQTEHIHNEKNVLKSISHPFIVRLYSTFKDKANLYLLMEFVPGGELFNYIRRATRLPNDAARIYAAEIILALEYLHSKDILYRDLKPENLLIDETGHIKLTDFGFAKFVPERTMSMCGTPEYIAPEIILSKGHAKPVDWWSLGILIFEMLAGYPPFNDEPNRTIFEKIVNDKPEIPSFFDDNARDLIEKLLCVDPTRRLGSLRGGVQDIKSHPWFSGIDFNALMSHTTPGPLNPGVVKDGDTHNFYKYSDVNLTEDLDPNVDYDKVFSDF